ncbi:MAG: serine/threonine-protein phosphatase, partial [Lachnospiraceae bacterium]|nr:serine/threonine-protein phosphatase [Lachnospiraceae bacterium]
ASDPRILEDWMDNQYSHYGPDYPDWSLLDSYEIQCRNLENIRNNFGMTSVYIQIDYEDDTYTLIDPEIGVFAIGDKEDDIPEFDDYRNNIPVPPTVYRNQYGWLCTSCATILDYDEEKPIGLACADLDMNGVVRERHRFLFNTILFIVALLIVILIINVLLVRHMVTSPLLKLQKGTANFSNADGGYSLDSVINLNITSNDEIQELYEDIRLMQTNIVRYTEDLTQITAERERVQTELDLAAKIQQAALPDVNPEFAQKDEYELDAVMLPARDVGGDFYDFFYLDGEHLALVIADVSGKGIPAALFMMMVKNLIQSHAIMGKSPAEILTEVNMQLSKNRRAHMFVTVWLGILNLISGELSACNAGHEEPVLKKNNGQFEIVHDEHGFVLAGLKKKTYNNYTLQLAPGDTFFIYTDGVPEATNISEEFYGIDRMVEALNKPGIISPSDILRTVRESVAEFADGSEQADDLTMLCFTFKGR